MARKLEPFQALRTRDNRGAKEVLVVRCLVSNRICGAGLDPPTNIHARGVSDAVWPSPCYSPHALCSGGNLEWIRHHLYKLSWHERDVVHDALSALEHLVSAAVVARELERSHAALGRALRADHVAAGDAQACMRVAISAEGCWGSGHVVR